MSKVLCVLPIKSNSSRIPGKNLKHFCGKPLCEWVMLNAKYCSYFDEIVVSSDSTEILELARTHGLSVHMRDLGMCSDVISATDVAFQVYQGLGKDFDEIAVMQATSPLLTSYDLKQFFDKWDLIKTNYEAMISVVEDKPITHYRQEVKDCLYPLLKEFRLFRSCGAVTVVKKEAFEMTALVESVGVARFQLDGISGVDIDTEFDWKIAEMFMKERLK